MKLLRWLALAVLALSPALYVLGVCALIGVYVGYAAWMTLFLTEHGCPFWLAVFLALLVIPVVVGVPLGIVGCVLFGGLAERLKQWVNYSLET